MHPLHLLSVPADPSSARDAGFIGLHQKRHAATIARIPKKPWDSLARSEEPRLLLNDAGALAGPGAYQLFLLEVSMLG